MLVKIIFNISLPSMQGSSAVCSLQVLPPISEQIYHFHHAYYMHYPVYPLNLVNLIIFWGRVHIMKFLMIFTNLNFHPPP